MVMDQKIAQILEEIDLARCRAQWSTCLELVKKYRKLAKSEDDPAVLDTTIQTEVELIQLLKLSNSSTDIEKRGWDIIHQHDTPHHISLLPIIAPNKVQRLIDRLFKFIPLEETKDDFSTKNWQIQFLKILLARVYFESGQYEKSLEALQNLALRMDDVQTGYGLVLLVQARAMKGICLEKQGHEEAAVEAYEAAWHAVELQPQERGVMLSFWIEQCLYRGVLLSLKLNHPVNETLYMMRAYLQLVSSHWSPYWRMFRRWIIFTVYTSYLIKTYQDNSYIPSIVNKNTIVDQLPSLGDNHAAVEELETLMNSFRHLFTIITPYLTSTEQKKEFGLQLAHSMMQAHDVIGWGETSHIRGALQCLYQVKNVTFNNATINRYLFFILLRLGSLEEAKHALRAYLDLMGVPDFDTGYMLDDDIKLVINPEDKNSATDLHQPLSTTTKAHRVLQRVTECDEEDLIAVVKVILAGAYLYGHEEQHGKLCAYLSDLAVDLMSTSGFTIDTKLMGEIYRAHGSSYGLLASQTVDPEDRATYYQSSITSFQKAVDTTPTCWKSFYGLGLQQGILRDIHAAIISIRKCIELNPKFVDGWHLLSLLYSCHRTDHLSLALKTLEKGLKYSFVHSVTTSGLSVYDFSQGGQVNASEVFSQAESYLSIRMTQITLKEAIEGPESVLHQYEELFKVYSKLVQQLGVMNQIENPIHSQATLSQSEGSIDQKGSRKTRRRRKSSLSLIRRSSLTSLANSISSNTSTITTRRRATSVDTDSRQSDNDDDFQDDNSQQVDEEARKKSLQLIDLGLARRIGTAAANPPQHHGSTTISHQKSTIVDRNAVSLASLLTPSYSMGSLRSNSVSSRSSSNVQNINNTVTAVTRDGLFVSTFLQRHQAFEIRQRTRWHSLLVTLWLMSSKSFMKAGLLEEAYKAVSEAEKLGLGDPGVWHQLGTLSLTTRQFQSESKMIREMNQVAHDAFEKALQLDPDYVPSQTSKATRFLENRDYEMAEGLLEHITTGLGWDSAEAWYALGSLKMDSGDAVRAKQCFLFALELNDTTPIRSLNIVNRFLF